MDVPHPYTLEIDYSPWEGWDIVEMGPSGPIIGWVNYPGGSMGRHGKTEDQGEEESRGGHDCE